MPFRLLLIMAVLAPAALFAESGSLPRPKHVVIVFEEDRDYKQVIGNERVPYMNELAQRGALMTQSFGVRHPSLPNYIAFFSGSTHGVKNNKCQNGPRFANEPNLGSELIRAGLTFTGFSESLPFAGYTGCARGLYARKHNPWVRFNNVPPESNQPFTSFPIQDFNLLPTVSIVVPNMRNNGHDASLTVADTWLRDNLSAYIEWTFANNSLFILTWDEGSRGNHIVTVFIGPMVQPGQYDRRINHYNVLRTLLDMYGLTPMAEAVTAEPILNIWR
ncbi:MAG TPA: alkaline phosphatase family protein [Planctomycetota bacterium]|nr:alkaline phosphatase family protein [Planctomycetota bacterium]